MNSVFDIVSRPVVISLICGDTDIFDSGYYEKLYDYYLAEMPYDVAKARSGDPDQWILDRLEEELGVCV
jgi:hypothetical protein